MDAEPDVDVVIAVHDLRRPLERAVRSALRHSARVRVTVVCHGLPAQDVEARLVDVRRPGAIRVIEHHDGVRSPAGPFNRGLDEASAPYTSVMGSDDVLEPGAVDSWLSTARRDRADVVIARVRHERGAPVRTPPARPWRRAGLEGVRDRLSYRSAPLGLVSTRRFGALRFTTGVEVGEDIGYVTELWFSRARISLDRGPAYVVMDDGPDRVTRTPKPVAAELAYLPRVLEALEGAPEDVVDAIVWKIVRVHVFGAVHNRPDPATWDERDRQGLRAAAISLLDAAPHGVEPFSRADRSLLDVILDTSVSPERLVSVARSRRRFGALATLVPRDVRWLLHREAPPRFMVASLLAGRRDLLGGGRR